MWWVTPALIVAALCSAMIMPSLWSVRRGTRLHWAQVLAMICVGAIIVSASIQRFANADRLLWASDEMVTLLAGIRLHLLPWWNLWADARENFFKSLVMPIHGLGDNIFFYVVTGVFRLFHIPLTERALFSAGAALSVVTLVLLFRLMQRLFGIGAALLAIAWAAWNITLIDFSTKGFQMNFVIFLQVASLLAYLRHITHHRWSTSLIMAGLMALCAGSELFYQVPIFLLLHLATQATARHDPAQRVMRLTDPKNLVVWGSYGAIFMLNVALFAIVGHRIPLTLFGQLAVKHHLGAAWVPQYGFEDFHRYFNLAFTQVPDGFVLACLAVLILPLVDRRPYAWVCSAYVLGLMGIAYVMRFSLTPNFMHLVIPVTIVVSGTLNRLVTWGLQRIQSLRPRREEVAGLLCVGLIMPIFLPWHLYARDPMAPPAYQGVKAVGFALRELGTSSNMNIRVLFLSDQVYLPPTMEYYTGMNASADDNEPTRIFHLRETSGDYLPRQIAQRVGIPSFDYYVEFNQEEFPFKSDVMADLETLKLHEVIRIRGADGTILATIFSPHDVPMRELSIEEGNRGFDRTYAHWKQLFSSVNVGAFWYYDANY